MKKSMLRGAVKFNGGDDAPPAPETNETVAPSAEEGSTAEAGAESE